MLLYNPLEACLSCPENIFHKNVMPQYYLENNIAIANLLYDNITNNLKSCICLDLSCYDIYSNKQQNFLLLL